MNHGPCSIKVCSGWGELNNLVESFRVCISGKHSRGNLFMEKVDIECINMFWLFLENLEEGCVCMRESWDELISPLSLSMSLEPLSIQEQLHHQ